MDEGGGDGEDEGTLLNFNEYKKEKQEPCLSEFGFGENTQVKIATVFVENPHRFLRALRNAAKKIFGEED